MTTFYKVIIQRFLLCGLESWVKNNYMKDKLNSLHRRCSSYTTGRPFRVVHDVWILTECKMTLEIAGSASIEERITKRRDTISVTHI